jgi:hypothetical protein
MTCPGEKENCALDPGEVAHPGPIPPHLTPASLGLACLALRVAMMLPANQIRGETPISSSPNTCVIETSFESSDASFLPSLARSCASARLAIKHAVQRCSYRADTSISSAVRSSPLLADSDWRNEARRDSWLRSDLVFRVDSHVLLGPEAHGSVTTVSQLKRISFDTELE